MQSTAARDGFDADGKIFSLLVRRAELDRDGVHSATWILISQTLINQLSLFHTRSIALVAWEWGERWCTECWIFHDTLYVGLINMGDVQFVCSRGCNNNIYFVEIQFRLPEISGITPTFSVMINLPLNSVISKLYKHIPQRHGHI